MPRGGADGRFDVVVANIGARTLVELAPWLRDRTGDGGVLVLSGLLDPPPPEVAEAFAPLVVAQVRRLDGWVALLLGGRRTSARSEDATVGV